MARSKRTVSRVEFGDFQTPRGLARAVCELLKRRSVAPASILEPTCGVGNFLAEAVCHFPSATRAVGLDINPLYVNATRSVLRESDHPPDIQIIRDDFFSFDWASLFNELPKPVLVVGNPPWVTNAELGSIGSSNLPEKSNFQNRVGYEAVTGRSNFDISEWMLIRLLESLDGREAVLAMLCKTGVARRSLMHVWRRSLHVVGAQLYHIDADEHFGAAVEACLLVCTLSSSSQQAFCSIYDNLQDDSPRRTFGLENGELVADLGLYAKWKHLRGVSPYKWRSGIKHDCARVMELTQTRHGLKNGFAQCVDLEPDYLYPMLKSSEVSKGRDVPPRRWMLVTQRRVGQDTAEIQTRAPKTWAYLQEHGERLARRSSSIYRNRPPFSIFGVGEYSFSRWKVAVSGFYKDLRFRVINPFLGKPVVLDDTSYFLSCDNQKEATFLASLLESDAARGFFDTFIFWDAKRPVTADILGRLDLCAAARELGSETTMRNFLDHRTQGECADRGRRRDQELLFEVGLTDRRAPKSLLP